jgi:predicted membrane protein
MNFQHEVVNRKVERVTARQIVSGLQWYVHHREYCLEDFSVDNPVGNACIDVQREMFLNNDNTTDKDPHKDLKDVLPASSRLALMIHV